jgi:hypothetical protein
MHIIPTAGLGAGDPIAGDKSAQDSRRDERIPDGQIAPAGRSDCLIVRRAPAEATSLDSEIRRLGDRNAIIEE